MNMNWIFIEVKEVGDREAAAVVLVKNGYEVRMGKRIVDGKKTYRYGIEYREQRYGIEYREQSGMQ